MRRLWKGYKELSLGHVKFGMTRNYPSRDAKYAVGFMTLDSRESSWLELTFKNYHHRDGS